ncbi:MAG: NADP-dependent oxidoreductase [Sphingomonadales bacterium]|nr:NADP-dependent oxidoreductase [Sphingomonadales bacterium]
MKAVVLDRFGGPEVLRIAQIDRPSLAPGQVVIEVAYASVNPADWKAREGWLARYFQYEFPFVLGFDAAGIVAEVGDGVTHVKPGDRVVTPGNQGMGERGSYAEFVRAAAERVIPLPERVTLRDAATLPTAGMTAWQATLDPRPLGLGSVVVVNGGAGGTGSFAIQLAKMVGARVAATCSPRNFDYVRSLGADLSVDYRGRDLFAALRDWAGGGIDLAVDTVGQGTFVGVLPIMKRGGVITNIGTLIADEATIEPAAAKAAGVTVIPTVSAFPEQPRQLAALVDALAAGRIQAPEITELPLDQAAEAHRRIQGGHVRGKIVLAVNAGLDA